MSNAHWAFFYVVFSVTNSFDCLKKNLYKTKDSTKVVRLFVVSVGNSEIIWQNKENLKEEYDSVFLVRLLHFLYFSVLGHCHLYIVYLINVKYKLYNPYYFVATLYSSYICFHSFLNTKGRFSPN